jgi:hypothetical protein
MASCMLAGAIVSHRAVASWLIRASAASVRFVPVGALLVTDAVEAAMSGLPDPYVIVSLGRLATVVASLESKAKMSAVVVT